MDNNCVKSRKFDAYHGECWVPTLYLRETWTSLCVLSSHTMFTGRWVKTCSQEAWTSITQSTLSRVHFDYKKGVGISNYVRLMDHTRVKYRKPEICHGECWSHIWLTGGVDFNNPVNIVWNMFRLHIWGVHSTVLENLKIDNRALNFAASGLPSEGSTDLSTLSWGVW